MLAIRYIAMMIALLFMFGVVALPGFLDKVGLGFLGGPMGMAQMGSSKPKVVLPPDPAEGEAGKYVRRADGAVFATGPVAATPGGAPIFIAEILEGYAPKPPTGDEMQFAVAEIAADRRAACATPFYDGSVMNHVYGYDSTLDSPLLSVTSMEFAGAMEVFVNTYRQSGRGHINKSTRNSRLKLLHVVVPAQAAPVHLVLSNGGKRLLWSLQLAEGAKLAGVTVLGGRGNAVAHVPADVPVHILEAGALRDCDITPAFPRVASPNNFATQKKTEDWQAEERAENKGLTKREQARRDYDLWFQARFDQSRDAGLSGYAKADVVVSAPWAGGAPVAFQPLRGARVVVPQGGLTFGGSLGVWPTAYEALLIDTLTGFAGGDLKNLRLNLGN